MARLKDKLDNLFNKRRELYQQIETLDEESSKLELEETKIILDELYESVKGSSYLKFTNSKNTSFEYIKVDEIVVQGGRVVIKHNEMVRLRIRDFKKVWEENDTSENSEANTSYDFEKREKRFSISDEGGCEKITKEEFDNAKKLHYIQLDISKNFINGDIRINEMEAIRRFSNGEKFEVSVFIDEDSIIAGYGELNLDFEFPLPASYIKQIYGTLSWAEYNEKEEEKSKMYIKK